MIKILVVDDMPENIRLLRKILGDEGFSVSEAANGEQALAAAAAGMPDMALIDLRLGKDSMTGYDLAGCLRQLPGGEAVVLVAMSGGAVLDDEAMSRKTGFDGCLFKPFDFANLSQQLKKLLAAKAAAPGRDAGR